MSVACPHTTAGEYCRLKERGVLVRHFGGERVKDFNRVTIGSPEEMELFINETEKILEEL